MNVIVTRLVKHQLSLGNHRVGALKVVQNLYLVLIYGLHELLRPKPNIIVLVHEQKGLLRYLLFDLWHSLRVKIFEKCHYGFHILLIPAIKQ